MPAAFQQSHSIITGTPVSPGVGYGRPCYYRIDRQEDETARSVVNPDRIYREAFDQLDEQLESFAGQADAADNPDSADLFRAHRMICNELQEEVLRAMDCGQLTAKKAIEQCFDDYSDYFRRLDDDYMRERAGDFDELKQLLLNLLENSRAYLECREFRGCEVGECSLKNAHILICDDLTANVAIRIRRHTKGIIAHRCGRYSHAAVITRSLGIPVISGIEQPRNSIAHDEMLLVNGNTGEIVINPGEAERSQYRELNRQTQVSSEVVDPVPGLTVLADIDRSGDMEEAMRMRAEGIGLYRTEFEILARNRVPGEKEQAQTYRQLVEYMAGRPVYIRLFDLGSDKSIPGLKLEDEENPALGRRGARLLLDRPELLQPQARAIASASVISPVNVIYPVVTTVEEFLDLKRIFMDAAADIKNAAIAHGIMFEVPVACMNAARFYEVIDFGRIGSSDLLQYLFATDRTGPDVNLEKQVNDPAVWPLFRQMADAAAAAGKPLELCGSMAALPEVIPAIMQLGINTVSTRPEYIAMLRKAALINQ